MNTERGALLVGALRAVSMPMLLAAAAVVFLVSSIVGWGQLMRSADRQEDAIAQQHLRIAAETALIEKALRSSSSSSELQELLVGGVALRLRRPVGPSQDGAEHDLVDSLGEAPSVRFASRRLAGAPALAFGRRRVAANAATLAQIGGGCLLGVGDWPRLDSQQVAAASRAGRAAGFVRDRAIALRLLASGTDRPDFVWQASQASVAHPPAGSLLVVPGNLWIPPADDTFELHLERDLVVLVEGNLYLLRSLRTSGPGRLLLATVALASAVVFADVDGGGDWSRGDCLRVGEEFAGPIEGTGSVYAGLPGLGHASVMRVDCALLASGELHLAAPLRVSGPLLLRHGVTPLPGVADVAVAELLPAAEPGWSYVVGRDWVPGFEVCGPPRPGRLEIRIR